MLQQKAIHVIPRRLQDIWELRSTSRLYQLQTAFSFILLSNEVCSWPFVIPKTEKPQEKDENHAEMLKVVEQGSNI